MMFTIKSRKDCILCEMQISISVEPSSLDLEELGFNSRPSEGRLGVHLGFDSWPPQGRLGVYLCLDSGSPQSWLSDCSGNLDFCLDSRPSEPFLSRHPFSDKFRLNSGPSESLLSDVPLCRDLSLDSRPSQWLLLLGSFSRQLIRNLSSPDSLFVSQSFCMQLGFKPTFPLLCSSLGPFQSHPGNHLCLFISLFSSLSFSLDFSLDPGPLLRGYLLSLLGSQLSFNPRSSQCLLSELSISVDLLLQSRSPQGSPFSSDVSLDSRSPEGLLPDWSLSNHLSLNPRPP